MSEGREAGATAHAGCLERKESGPACHDRGRWGEVVEKGSQRILELPGESVLLETLPHSDS